MDAPGQLLCSVGFVEDVFRQRLEVIQMRTGRGMRQGVYNLNGHLPKNGTTEPLEIGVLWVVYFGNTPGINPCADSVAINLDNLFRTNNRKWKHSLRGKPVHGCTGARRT